MTAIIGNTHSRLRLLGPTPRPTYQLQICALKQAARPAVSEPSSIWYSAPQNNLRTQHLPIYPSYVTSGADSLNRQDHLVGLRQPHPRGYGQRPSRAMVHLRSQSREARTPIPAEGIADRVTIRFHKVVQELTVTMNDFCGKGE